MVDLRPLLIKELLPIAQCPASLAANRMLPAVFGQGLEKYNLSSSRRLVQSNEKAGKLTVNA